MKPVGKRSCLSQETSGFTGRRENASTIGASCHWCTNPTGVRTYLCRLGPCAIWDLAKAIWCQVELAEAREYLYHWCFVLFAIWKRFSVWPVSGIGGKLGKVLRLVPVSLLLLELCLYFRLLDFALLWFWKEIWVFPGRLKTSHQVEGKQWRV